MAQRHEKLGIKQTIQKEWMDLTVRMMLAGLSETEIRSELDDYLSTQKQSGGVGRRGEKTYGMAISLLASWFAPERDLRSFRDDALTLAKNIKPTEWLPLHWAVISASYPFWLNVAKQTGRLLNLQDQITQAQVFNRLKEKYGDRETVGFSFTRNKNGVRPVIESDDYIDTIPDLAHLTVEGLKRDRLFVHDVDGDITEHSVYRCIYFEILDGDKTKIIFDGKWYEVDATFIGRVAETLDLVPISTLPFPTVEIWEEDGKSKIESEGDYNIRAAAAYGYFLLDKRLVKTNRTTSPIELCDLLTPAKQLVHVKHRKGGSAGLSHLFAQGGVAAEIMLGDKAFRKKARTVLRGVNLAAQGLIRLAKPSRRRASRSICMSRILRRSPGVWMLRGRPWMASSAAGGGDGFIVEDGRLAAAVRWALRQRYSVIAKVLRCTVRPAAARSSSTAACGTPAANSASIIGNSARSWAERLMRGSRPESTAR
ncbi:TIGR04141 family sporadically distributed protein [Eoetvoesiella caeni]|uniref:Uncharacterized protein (TIGR04141 family) n=1 Tax=Eoetvoesiella caeni TaxID=645616 RepID=A0A366H1V5_9BURK|nr:TIGR04141 family sporadically distributed protein [Eoetvoesiella caeni]MCI2811007.1 TIGR04141 family sporadically distributed protein [Eoetvoesiella caeni]NYT56907.1 TIGR04141 family sporadically distributed protein [Eoetvoesiella caeni]RBP35231.1 uncharacterized protein (TIGR04141 family) [Eoetvoesiella caeni]